MTHFANMTEYSTVSVYHLPDRKELVCEASMLGLRPGHKCQPLYNDAIDIGISLRSHKTGEVSRWLLKEEIQDTDGDVRAWVFGVAYETEHKIPALSGYTLRIIND